MLRRRHRYGPSAFEAAPSPLAHVGRRIVVLLIAAAALFYAGKAVLGFFGIGGQLRETSVLLQVEPRGTVRVSLQGEEFKDVRSDLKLYPDDQVLVGPAAHASLSFFDGTWLRFGSDALATVDESSAGSEESSLSLTAERGEMWISTPDRRLWSGAVVRVIETPTLAYLIPAATEALVSPDRVVVYRADGLGVEVTLPERGERIMIGEGQEYRYDPVTAAVDPYSTRSPIDPAAARSPFLVESLRIRQAMLNIPAAVPAGTGSTLSENSVVILEPAEGATVQGSTVQVTGRVGKRVTDVRINGYQAPINPLDQTFAQEVTLPDEETVQLHIEAVGPDGILLAELQRTVKRNRTPPGAPVIISPAGNGQTYRTNQESLVIRGTPPADAVGIIVNDYRLQLFTPGDVEWSYLASTRLANMQQGPNLYTVTAVNRGGYISEPASITILVEEGPEGIVGGVTPPPPAAAGSAASAASSVSSVPLQDNPPLSPGTLQVTGPTAGTSHSATGSEILLQGATSRETDSMWVNDYRLQLFTPGKTTWNYIASTAFNTLKRGRNVYTVVSRNKEGQILDKVDYVVTFNPRGND